jgi:hypothetical protein
LLVISGCGTRELVTAIEQETSQGDAVIGIPGSWVTYENERYGYSFSYPKQAVLFADVTDNLEVVPVGTQDPVVMLTDASESMLLQSEVNTITIEVVEDARSAHEWISTHLNDYYPQGVAGQTSGVFAGEETIVLRGDGSLGSPEKVIVLSRNSFVYVISYGMSSITFEEILDTFELF